MKEFFSKHGGRYGDPYEAIEMICERLYRIKEKVAEGDPSHIKDLSEISDMIDDYVNAIQDEDLKPIQRGMEYQDYQPQGEQEGVRGIFPLYPFYENESRGGRGGGGGYRNEIGFRNDDYPFYERGRGGVQNRGSRGVGGGMQGRGGQSGGSSNFFNRGRR